MTSQVLAISSEMSTSTAGDQARTQSSVSDLRNRTVSEISTRLLRVAEDLARVAADVVVTLHTPPAVIVAEPAPAAEHEAVPPRAAWKVVEFAESLGLNPETVRELLRAGEIRGFKVRQEWRISEEARCEFIANKERATAEELGLAS